MDDDVSAEFNGALEVGAEKGVSTTAWCAFVGELGHRGDIRDTERGVGRRLDGKAFCGSAKRCANGIRRGSVHETEFQAKVHKKLRGKPEHAAVDGFGKEPRGRRGGEAGTRRQYRHADEKTSAL